MGQAEKRRWGKVWLTNTALKTLKFYRSENTAFIDLEEIIIGLISLCRLFSAFTDQKKTDFSQLC